MALPVAADLRAVLRIQTTGEDTFLTWLLTRATAIVQGLLGRPILKVTDYAWVDELENHRAFSARTKLTVPVFPFDPSTLAIEDADGVELVLDTDYRAPKGWDSLIRAVNGTAFTNAPYTVTADVGLETSTAPAYSTAIEPVIAAAILDVAADMYQRRNPAASSESTGGGVSTSYVSDDVIARVRGMLAPFTVVRVV